MTYLSYFIFALGLLLSATTFFYPEGHRRANRYLSALLFTTAILFFFNFHIVYSDSFNIVFLYTFGFNQLYFLVGPFAYFYIRGTLRDDARLKPLELLHFVPFVVLITGMLPFYLFPMEKKIEVARLLYERKWEAFLSVRLNLFMSYFYTDILRIMSIVGYAIAQWVLLWKYRSPGDLTGIALQQFTMIRKWLIIFAVLYSILAVQRLVIGGLMLFKPLTAVLIEATAITFLSMAVLYVGLNFGIFIFNNLFLGIMVTPVEHAGNNHEVSKAEIQPVLAFKRNEHRLLRNRGLFHENYLEEIGQSLDEWIAHKKYLTKSNLQDLSDETGIPAHHLTYYFNTVLGTKFTDWRNTYRIAHAKDLIDEGFMITLSLDGIAENCGFNSRATFFRVFKEITGITPSEYNDNKNSKS